MAALAAQPRLSNIGSIRWTLLLSGHLLTIAVALGALALTGWAAADLVGNSPPLWPWIGVAAGVSVAAALQARIGPPNIGKILDAVGFSGLGGVLAMRSVIPFVVAATAVIGMARMVDNARTHLADALETGAQTRLIIFATHDEDLAYTAQLTLHLQDGNLLDH